VSVESIRAYYVTCDNCGAAEGLDEGSKTAKEARETAQRHDGFTRSQTATKTVRNLNGKVIKHSRLQDLCRECSAAKATFKEAKRDVKNLKVSE
jgi:hypothetical protein